MPTFAQMMEGPDHASAVILRQVGWLVAGGDYDGEFVAWPEDPRIKCPSTQEERFPMGSYSPVYIEIGDD